jgi:hypothetical protein
LAASNSCASAASAGVTADFAHVRVALSNEADRAFGHAQRERRVLGRGIVEVGARGRVERGDRAQAGDDGAQALARGREGALHEAVDGLAGQARVGHRVAPPALERREIEELGARLRHEEGAIEGVVGGQGRRRERLELRDEGAHLRGAREDARRGQIFELAIVGVQAHGRAGRRREREHSVEVGVDDPRILRR